jgi:serine/threonine protein phosphatase 1
MGGDATLRSYGGSTSELNYALVPRSHIAFLESCVNYFETETHFFLHASYVATLPLADQPILALRWESLRDEIPPPHFSGKTAIVGHTSQKNGKILNKGYLVCIDTNCAGGGWLTAVDIHSGRIWQASRDGKLRGKLRTV